MVARMLGYEQERTPNFRPLGDQDIMKAQQFQNILQDRIDKIREVLSSKQKEYATDHDKLHNFKEGARIDGKRTSAQVCWGYILKHLTSIHDIVNEIAAGNTAKLPLIDEKIGDAINYLILLEAILKDGER